MAFSDSLKYFAWFAAVMVSAFLSFRFFTSFHEAVNLSEVLLILNAGLIFMIWFLAFTAKSGFVEENVKLIVFIPLFTLYLTDMYIAVQYGSDAVGSFMAFMSSSAFMIAASYQFSRYEKMLKEDSDVDNNPDI